MVKIRSAHFFLLGSGAVLLIAGGIGFLGLVGPTPEQSIFGNIWFFTGLLILAAVFLVDADVPRRQLTIIVGYLAFCVAVASFFLPAVGTYPPGNLGYVGNLENPADTILHLVLTVWAFWSVVDQSTSRSTKL
jgi:hypothetical protein